MQVDLFEQVVFWPFRLIPSGSLKAKRSDPDVTPGEWLEAYGDWIEDTASEPSGKKPWRSTGTTFWDAFGFRGDNQERVRMAEFNYFHPFVQQILHPESEQASIRVLTRDDVRFVRIQLDKDGTPWEFPVNRVQLFLFPTDLAIVAVQWSGGPLDVTDVLKLLNRARRIYPPYWAEEGGKLEGQQVPYKMQWLNEKREPIYSEKDGGFDACKIVVSADHRPPVSEHWRCLVRPIKTHGPGSHGLALEDGLVLKQVEDERCPTMAYIAMAEPERVSLTVQANLTFFDEGEESWYARPFLRNFERDHCYDRYWDWGGGWNTRYFFSPWSFVALGQSSPNERGEKPFFVEHIRTHFERHYFLMMLIARMQKASLLVFWSRLAEVMHDYSTSQSGRTSHERFHRDVKWLMSDVADFVSRFWFSEISNQVQARELFENIHRHLETKKLYAEVMEQTKFVREVLLNALNEEKARFDEGVSRITLYLVPVYLTVSVLGMSWLSEWLHLQGWLRFRYLAIAGGFLLVVFFLLARLSIPGRVVPRVSDRKREGRRWPRL